MAAVHLHAITDPRLPALLQQGAVGVLPTDTVYGLAAAAHNPYAVAQLYALKNRERKPGTIIAANIEQLAELGIDAAALQRAAGLWPNPISVVLPADAALAYVHQGVGSLAVRIPDDEALQALLLQTGPLVTSSANHPGHPPASTLAEAEAYFAAHVAFYVDGGDRSGQPASTVVRLTPAGTFETLRAGALAVTADGHVSPTK